MLNNLKQQLEISLDFRLNKNQFRDIERLFFEITRREDITCNTLIEHIKHHSGIEKYGGRNKFFALKSSLIKRRFPLTTINEHIDTKKVFLNQIRAPLTNNYRPKRDFKPLKIFVEKCVKDTYLAENFRKFFPDIKIEEINLYSDYLKKNKFEISELKKPVVFIIKEDWDFLKPCPCTKEHLRCGYWILNLGFGCPFDCSYCFLQCYANFPGIILPANLDDFFRQFESFHKKLQKPIRIGTGEFCDSLALDEITEYSSRLIPYFADKNVFFELKTKSNKITNLLKLSPPKNIIISWSLNPPDIIRNEEFAATTLQERLEAAKMVQEKGYRIAFHFDPIIHSKNWEKSYAGAVDMIYSKLKPPFAWISLGTLRSHRNLKMINEIRFPESNIFYGELFLGDDKKLRYPQFLRKEIYRNMTEFIKRHDSDTPIYLCMENKDVWKMLGQESSKGIENYLIQKNKI